MYSINNNLPALKSESSTISSQMFWLVCTLFKWVSTTLLFSGAKNNLFLPYKCFDKSIWSFELFLLKGLSEAVFNKCFNIFMSFEAICDHIVWQPAEHSQEKKEPSFHWQIW